MNLYEITICGKFRYDVTVPARDRNEAQEIGLDMFYDNGNLGMLIDENDIDIWCEWCGEV